MNINYFFPYLIYLLKIGLALCLGCLVGYEREVQKKPAGFRDIILVTVGATICSILALEMLYIKSTNYDVGRIIAYTIVSIGFLGSGVLSHNKKEGITTGCVLWTMVIIGLCCGLCKYILAIITGLVIYLILKLKYLKIKFEKRRKHNAKKKR